MFNETLLEIKLLSSMDESPIIEGDLAYEIINADQRTSNSVVVERVNTHFRELFNKRFIELYPKGLTLSAQSQRSFKYQPASPTLNYKTNSWQELQVPHILGYKKQFTPLVKAWNECIEELRSLSRLKQKGIELNTKEAFRVLPDELKQQLDHPDKQKWDSFMLQNAREDGLVIATVDKLIHACVSYQSSKLTLKQSKELVDTANDMGLSIIPDPKLTSRAYENNDLVALIKESSVKKSNCSESVPVNINVQDIINKASTTDYNGRYDLIPDSTNELIQLKSELTTLKANRSALRSERSTYNKLVYAIDKKLASYKEHQKFKTALIMLELGMVVAAADNKIDNYELRHISEFLETQFRLNPNEIYKLEAYQEILKIQPPQMSKLVRKLKSALTLVQTEVLLKFLVGVAAANSIIHEKEVSVLEKIYSSLGVDVQKLYTTISQLKNIVDEPTIIKNGKPPAIGEAIPSTVKQEYESKVNLNEDYLRQILDETNMVTSILSEALLEAEEVTEGKLEEIPIPMTKASDEQFPELEKKYHQVLAELLIIEEWNRKEFHELVKKHGLMPASVVEVVNTWSDEHLGDFLIIEGTNIRVNKDLLETLQ